MIIYVYRHACYGHSHCHRAAGLFWKWDLIYHNLNGDVYSNFSLVQHNTSYYYKSSLFFSGHVHSRGPLVNECNTKRNQHRFYTRRNTSHNYILKDNNHPWVIQIVLLTQRLHSEIYGGTYFKSFIIQKPKKIKWCKVYAFLVIHDNVVSWRP